jgi:hypothetical protein
VYAPAGFDEGVCAEEEAGDDEPAGVAGASKALSIADSVVVLLSAIVMLSRISPPSAAMATELLRAAEGRTARNLRANQTKFTARVDMINTDVVV